MYNSANPMRTKRLGLRSISLLLTFTMVLSDLLYAAPVDNFLPALSAKEALLEAPQRFEAPLDFSLLKDVRRGEKKTFIIHIQDAHSNLSGQQNLAAALDELMKRYDVSLVLVEGGTRDDSLTPLKKLAKPDVWKRVAKKFLMEGKISGEEYLNLTSDRPMKIMGIEDKELYWESLRAYDKLSLKREEAVLQSKRLRNALEKLKNKLYPQELVDYERLGSASSGFVDKGFEERFKKLVSLASTHEKAAQILKGFTNIKTLLEIQEKEKDINFNLANLEQAALLDAIAKRGGSADIRTAVARLSALKDSRLSQLNFIEILFRAAREKSVALDAYPNLPFYEKYLQSFLSVDFEKLFDEFERLEDETYRALLPEKDALLVRSIDRYAGLLDTAYRIQMSTKEFESFKLNEPDFSTAAYLAFINRKLADLGYTDDLIPMQDVFEEAKSALTDFYASVSRRDEAFMRNTERILAEEKQQVAVLIAGGYHTSNLKKLFNEKDYSYAVLAPIVTSETNQKKYENVLLEPIRKESNIVESVTGETKENDKALSALEADLQSLKRKTDGIRAEAAAESGARLAEVMSVLPPHPDAAEVALSMLRGQNEEPEKISGARLSLPGRHAGAAASAKAELAAPNLLVESGGSLQEEWTRSSSLKDLIQGIDVVKQQENDLRVMLRFANDNPLSIHIKSEENGVINLIYRYSTEGKKHTLISGEYSKELMRVILRWLKERGFVRVELALFEDVQSKSPEVFMRQLLDALRTSEFLFTSPYFFRQHKNRTNREIVIRLDSRFLDLGQAAFSGARLAETEDIDRLEARILRRAANNFSGEPDPEKKVKEVEKFIAEAKRFYEKQELRARNKDRELYREALLNARFQLEWKQDLDQFRVALYLPARRRVKTQRVKQMVQEQTKGISDAGELYEANLRVLAIPSNGDFENDARSQPNYVNYLLKLLRIPGSDGRDSRSRHLLLAAKLADFILYAEQKGFTGTEGMEIEDPLLKELLLVYSTLADRTHLGNVADTINSHAYRRLSPELYFLLISQKIRSLAPVLGHAEASRYFRELDNLERLSATASISEEGKRMNRLINALSDISWDLTQRVEASFSMANLLTQLRLDGVDVVQATFRVKSDASIFEKIAIREEYNHPQELHDLTGIMITSSLTGIGRAVDSLSKFFHGAATMSGAPDYTHDEEVHMDFQGNLLGQEGTADTKLEANVMSEAHYRDYRFGTVEKKSTYLAVREHSLFRRARRWRLLSGVTKTKETKNEEDEKNAAVRFRSSEDLDDVYASIEKRRYMVIYVRDGKRLTKRVLELSDDASLGDLLFALDLSPDNVFYSDTNKSLLGTDARTPAKNLETQLPNGEYRSLYIIKHKGKNSLQKWVLDTATKKPDPKKQKEIELDALKMVPSALKYSEIALRPKTPEKRFLLDELVTIADRKVVDGAFAKNEDGSYQTVREKKRLEDFLGEKGRLGELDVYALDAGFTGVDMLFRAIHGGLIRKEDFLKDFSDYVSSRHQKLPPLSRASGARLSQETTEQKIRRAFTGLAAITDGYLPANFKDPRYGKPVTARLKRAFSNGWKIVEEIIEAKKFSEKDAQLVRKAFVLAFIAHQFFPSKPGNQFRRVGNLRIPYMVHPVDVAESLVQDFEPLSRNGELTFDAAAIAVAILHDVLEDTQLGRLTNEELSGFLESATPVVWEMVRHLTKVEGQPDALVYARLLRFPETKMNRSNLEKRYIQMLIIKLADKLSSSRLDYLLITQKQLSHIWASRILSYLESRQQFAKHFANFLYRTNRPILREASLFWLRGFLEVQSNQMARIQKRFGAPFLAAHRQRLNRLTFVQRSAIEEDGWIARGANGESEYRVVEFSQLRREVSLKHLRRFFGSYWMAMRASFSPIWQPEWLENPRRTEILVSAPQSVLHAVLIFKKSDKGVFNRVVGGYLFDSDKQSLEAIATWPDARGLGATHVLLEDMRDRFLKGKRVLRAATLPPSLDSEFQPDSKDGHISVRLIDKGRQRNDIEKVLNVGPTIRSDADSGARLADSAMTAEDLEKLKDVALRFFLEDIGQPLREALSRANTPKEIIEYLLEELANRYDVLREEFIEKGGKVDVASKEEVRELLARSANGTHEGKALHIESARLLALDDAFGLAVHPLSFFETDADRLAVNRVISAYRSAVEMIHKSGRNRDSVGRALQRVLGEAFHKLDRHHFWSKRDLAFGYLMLIRLTQSEDLDWAGPLVLKKLDTLEDPATIRDAVNRIFKDKLDLFKANYQKNPNDLLDEDLLDPELEADLVFALKLLRDTAQAVKKEDGETPVLKEDLELVMSKALELFPDMPESEKAEMRREFTPLRIATFAAKWAVDRYARAYQSATQGRREGLPPSIEAQAGLFFRVSRDQDNEDVAIYALEKVYSVYTAFMAILDLFKEDESARAFYELLAQRLNFRNIKDREGVREVMENITGVLNDVDRTVRASKRDKAAAYLIALLLSSKEEKETVSAIIAEQLKELGADALDALEWVMDQPYINDKIYAEAWYREIIAKAYPSFYAQKDEVRPALSQRQIFEEAATLTSGLRKKFPSEMEDPPSEDSRIKAEEFSRQRYPNQNSLRYLRHEPEAMTFISSRYPGLVFKYPKNTDPDVYRSHLMTITEAMRRYAGISPEKIKKIVDGWELWNFPGIAPFFITEKGLIVQELAQSVGDRPAGLETPAKGLRERLSVSGVDYWNQHVNHEGLIDGQLVLVDLAAIRLTGYAERILAHANQEERAPTIWVVSNEEKKYGAEAADIIAPRIQSLQKQFKRDVPIIFATGTTKAMLEALAKDPRVDFLRIAYFQLAEYKGLAPSHNFSAAYALKRDFLDKLPVKVPEEKIYFINNNTDPQHIFEALHAMGGADMALLGVGRNGQIGFNEPLSSFDSTGREVDLSDETVQAKKNENPQLLEVLSARAITFGIADLMAAKEVFILANDPSKKPALDRAINDPISEQNPASVFRRHPRASYILSENALPDAQRGARLADSQSNVDRKNISQVTEQEIKLLLDHMIDKETLDRYLNSQHLEKNEFVRRITRRIHYHNHWLNQLLGHPVIFSSTLISFTLLAATLKIEDPNILILKIAIAILSFYLGIVALLTGVISGWLLWDGATNNFKGFITKPHLGPYPEIFLDSPSAEDKFRARLDHELVHALLELHLIGTDLPASSVQTLRLFELSGSLPIERFIQVFASNKREISGWILRGYKKMKAVRDGDSAVSLLDEREAGLRIKIEDYEGSFFIGGMAVALAEQNKDAAWDFLRYIAEGDRVSEAYEKALEKGPGARLADESGAILAAAKRINPSVDPAALLKLYSEFKHKFEGSAWRKYNEDDTFRRFTLVSRDDRLDETSDDDEWNARYGHRNGLLETHPVLDRLLKDFKIEGAQMEESARMYSMAARHYYVGEYYLYLDVPRSSESIVELYLRAGDAAVMSAVFGKYQDIEKEVAVGIRILGEPALPEVEPGNKEKSFHLFKRLGLDYPPGIVLSEQLVAAFVSATPEKRGIYLNFMRIALQSAGIDASYRLGEYAKDGVGGSVSVFIRSNPKVSMPGILETESGYVDNLEKHILKAAAAWDSEKARAYRRREGLSDLYDLPLIIQAAVPTFGAVTDQTISGSGIFTTRHTETNKPGLFGLFAKNLPGSYLMSSGGRGMDINELKSTAPDVYRELLEARNKIDEVAGPQEVEFAVGHGKVNFLQARKLNFSAAGEAAHIRQQLSTGQLSEARAIGQIEKLQRRQSSRQTFSVKKIHLARPVASAVATTSGAMHGFLAWRTETVDRLVKEGKPVIFVSYAGNREYFLTHLYSYSRLGLITNYGNEYSHEAVLTRAAGIASMIGLNARQWLLEDGLNPRIVLIGGTILREGDQVVIDGDNNALYRAGSSILKRGVSADDLSHGIDIAAFRDDFLRKYINSDGTLKPEYTTERLESLDQAALIRWEELEKGMDKRRAFVANLEKHFLHELLGLQEQGSKESGARLAEWNQVPELDHKVWTETNSGAVRYDRLSPVMASPESLRFAIVRVSSSDDDSAKERVFMVALKYIQQAHEDGRSIRVVWNSHTAAYAKNFLAMVMPRFSGQDDMEIIQRGDFLESEVKPSQDESVLERMIRMRQEWDSFSRSFNAGRNTVVAFMDTEESVLLASLLGDSYGNPRKGDTREIDLEMPREAAVIEFVRSEKKFRVLSSVAVANQDSLLEGEAGESSASAGARLAEADPAKRVFLKGLAAFALLPACTPRGADPQQTNTEAAKPAAEPSSSQQAPMEYNEWSEAASGAYLDTVKALFTAVREENARGQITDSIAKQRLTAFYERLNNLLSSRYKMNVTSWDAVSAQQLFLNARAEMASRGALLLYASGFEHDVTSTQTGEKQTLPFRFLAGEAFLTGVSSHGVPVAFDFSGDHEHLQSMDLGTHLEDTAFISRRKLLGFLNDFRQLSESLALVFPDGPNEPTGQALKADLANYRGEYREALDAATMYSYARLLAAKSTDEDREAAMVDNIGSHENQHILDYVAGRASVFLPREQEERAELKALADAPWFGLLMAITGLTDENGDESWKKARRRVALALVSAIVEDPARANYGIQIDAGLPRANQEFQAMAQLDKLAGPQIVPLVRRAAEKLGHSDIFSTGARLADGGVTRTARVVLQDERQRVLLLRKNNASSQAGLWELPGGNIDEGEGDEEAANREAEEETGLKGIILKAHGSLDKIVDTVAGKREVAVFSGNTRSRAQRRFDLVEKVHTTIRWVDLWDLKNYPMTEITKLSLEKALGPLFNDLPSGARLAAAPPDFYPKDYGLSTSITLKKSERAAELRSYLEANNVPQAGEIANTLIRSKAGSIDLLNKWGILNGDQSKALLRLSTERGVWEASLSPLVGDSSLAETLKRTVMEYPEQRKGILIKRLIPMAAVKQLIDEKKVPEYVVYAMLEKRFSLIPFIEDALRVVGAIQTRVGGPTHAWQIVVNQGHENAMAWAEKSESVVTQIQASVGSARNAWQIVVNQGSENAPEWVKKTEKDIPLIEKRTGSLARAWQIAISHENALAWTIDAEKVVAGIQERVGGLRNAWHIVISFGVDNALPWVERNEPQVLEKIQKESLSLTAAWWNHAAFSSDPQGAQLVDSSEDYDARPVGAGLVQKALAEYYRSIKNIVNPENKALVGVYGAAASDLSSFFLSTNASDAYFVGRYEKLSAEGLSKFIAEDPQQRSEFLKGFALDQRSLKFRRGFDEGNWMILDHNADAFYVALELELEGLGIDLSKVAVETKNGSLRIRFPWSFDGIEENERMRSVTYIDDEVESGTYLDSIETPIDLYYQRAAMFVTAVYPLFNSEGSSHYLSRLYSKMTPGGYFMTDAFEDAIFPEKEMGLIRMASPEFLETSITQIRQEQAIGRPMLGEGTEYLSYGWKMIVRQKPLSGARLAEASQEINELNLAIFELNEFSPRLFHGLIEEATDAIAALRSGSLENTSAWADKIGAVSVSVGRYIAKTGITDEEKLNNLRNAKAHFDKAIELMRESSGARLATKPGESVLKSQPLMDESAAISGGLASDGQIRFAEFYGARLAAPAAGVVIAAGEFPMLMPMGGAPVMVGSVNAAQLKDFARGARLSLNEQPEAAQPAMRDIASQEITAQLALEGYQIRVFDKAVAEMGITSTALEGIVGVDLKQFNPESLRVLKFAVMEIGLKYPKVQFYFMGASDIAGATKDAWEKEQSKRILISDSAVPNAGYVMIERAPEGRGHASRPILHYAVYLLGLRNANDTKATEVPDGVLSAVQQLAGNPSGARLTGQHIVGFAKGLRTPEILGMAQIYMVRAMDWVSAKFEEYLTQLQAVGQSA